jgi:hypothetical protein
MRAQTEGWLVYVVPFYVWARKLVVNRKIVPVQNISAGMFFSILYSFILL